MTKIYLNPLELSNIINDESRLDHQEPGDPSFIGITNGNY